MKTSLRLVAALWVVAVSYAVFVGWTLAAGYHAAARGDMPLYTDYTPTYAASMLVRDSPVENLYLPKMMAETGRRAAYAAYGGHRDRGLVARQASCWRGRSRRS